MDGKAPLIFNIRKGLTMTIYSKTDTGKVRSSNQDAVSSGVFEGGAWGVVCDGMGGANGGDIASSKAVEIIGGMLTQELDGELSGSEVRRIIEEAVSQANREIYAMAREDITLAGMGTTVVCAVVIGDTLYVAHAGDSRAYLLNSSRINLLTRDHSMVQELVNLGRLTEEEARNHPRKNVITRALGVYTDIEVDHTECTLEAGDMVLLCSDGLSNCVEEDRLLSMAQDIERDSSLCEAYIDSANTNGGPDNITALIICK